MKWVKGALWGCPAFKKNIHLLEETGILPDICQSHPETVCSASHLCSVCVLCGEENQLRASLGGPGRAHLLMLNLEVCMFKNVGKNHR